MDIICTPVESEIVVRVGSRRKRSSGNGEEGVIRTRRGAVNYRTTKRKCIEVIGRPQLPIPVSIDVREGRRRNTLFKNHLGGLNRNSN